MLEAYHSGKGFQRIGIKDLQNIGSRKVWIDATGLDAKESAALAKTFNLHPVSADDLHTPHSRIKVEEFKNYIFCVFYAVDSQARKVQVDFALGKDFVISSHSKPIPDFEVLKKDAGGVSFLIQKGPEYILQRLLEIVVEGYLPMIEAIDAETDIIEDELAGSPNRKLLERIFVMKRRISLLRRFSLPQREKISMLAKKEYPFISSAAVPYFRDVHDRAISVYEAVDNSRELVSSAFEVYMTAVNNEMNNVMKVLSIIATIALPLTVISGIFGTNFQDLPFTTEHFGFWIMIVAMLAICVVMIVYFRRKRWF